MTISIVIPVLNEEKSIARLLDYLLKIQKSEITKEIIIVDGGSSDSTIEILKSYPTVRVVSSPKGRAKQMNFGAEKATSDLFYFLHSDTFPPKDFDLEIVKKIKNGHLSGCFKMKFDNNHLVLRVSQWFTQFNHISCRGGDQSLFVERNLFKNQNGFDENLTIYEDNEFIKRLYKASKFCVIQKTVTTSARKYLVNGVWKLQYHFLIIHLKHKLGSTQKELHHYYQKNIK